jgi:hypothetical protein
MRKKFKTTKKSMRVLVTILISLACINFVMMAATVFASATVTPASVQDDAGKSFAATKVSELQTAKIEEKAAIVATNTQETATLNPAPTVITPKATTTKTTTTTAKAKTTTKTTTAAAPASKPATAPAPAATSSTSGISTLKNSASPALISAFDQLEFVIVVNPNSSYLGYFSTSKHSIEMRSISVSTFRHEIGHFLDVLKNMPSRSAEFAGIYSREKGLYTGTNAAYITSNAQEYFAQSYRNYLESASQLQAERPETYAFIVAQVTSISSADISRTYNQYSWSW